MKPSGYWNMEMCNVEAKKYVSRMDFCKGSVSAYGSAKRKGWLDIICDHMKEPIHWDTFEKCSNEAKKYKSRMEFRIGNTGAYESSRKKGWLDMICNHMVISGNRYHRHIYVYLFSDNHAYVGLTYNIYKRNNRHMLHGSVFNHIKKTNTKPVLTMLTDVPVDVDIAIKLEKIYYEKYLGEGWIMLNIKKTGSIGGNNNMWSREKCREEAKKYSNREAFHIGSNGACSRSRKYGKEFFEDICSHMISPPVNIIKWNREKCREEAKKYSNREAFHIGSNGACSRSRKYGKEFFEDICSHMNYIDTSIWNKENCREEAKKYMCKSDFINGSGGAYNRSRKYGLEFLESICSHMIKSKFARKKELRN